MISETVHSPLSAISKGALLPEPPRGFGWCIPEKLGHFFTINKTFSEAETQLEQYDAVYCAGGRGPEYIRTSGGLPVAAPR